MRILPLIALVASVTASAVAFTHPNSILGILITAPGYLVQAWLFERHWALGGVGYAATMISVSALFWTLFLTGAAGMTVFVARRLRRV